MPLSTNPLLGHSRDSHIEQIIRIPSSGLGEAIRRELAQAQAKHASDVLDAMEQQLSSAGQIDPGLKRYWMRFGPQLALVRQWLRLFPQLHRALTKTLSRQRSGTVKWTLGEI